MEYMSALEAAKEWGISKRRVQLLCSQNRIEGVKRIGNMWLIPRNSNKPADARLRCNLYDSSSKNEKIY